MTVSSDCVEAWWTGLGLNTVYLPSNKSTKKYMKNQLRS